MVKEGLNVTLSKVVVLEQKYIAIDNVACLLKNMASCPSCNTNDHDEASCPNAQDEEPVATEATNNNNNNPAHPDKENDDGFTMVDKKKAARGKARLPRDIPVALMRSTRHALPPSEDILTVTEDKVKQWRKRKEDKRHKDEKDKQEQERQAAQQEADDEAVLNALLATVTTPPQTQSDKQAVEQPATPTAPQKQTEKTASSAADQHSDSDNSIVYAEATNNILDIVEDEHERSLLHDANEEGMLGTEQTPSSAGDSFIKRPQQQAADNTNQDQQGQAVPDCVAPTPTH